MEELLLQMHVDPPAFSTLFDLPVKAEVLARLPLDEAFALLQEYRIPSWCAVAVFLSQFMHKPPLGHCGLVGWDFPDMHTPVNKGKQELP